MSDLPRRPISIWIAQIVILLFGLPLTLLVILVSLREWAWLISNDVPMSSFALAFGVSILRLGVVCLFAFAFVGLVRRKRYGRWLAVTVISIMILFSIIGLIFRPSGPLPYQEYENSTQRMGGMFATVTIYGLLGLLLYHLVSSDSVSDFFSPPELEVQSVEPPPPSTYFSDSPPAENTSATN